MRSCWPPASRRSVTILPPSPGVPLCGNVGVHGPHSRSPGRAGGRGDAGAAPRSFRVTLPPAGRPGPAAHIVYRLPTAGDLIALQDVADVEAARRALADRCVLEATWGGARPRRHELPDELLAALADEMSARDPQAEMLLDLTCPGVRRRGGRRFSTSPRSSGPSWPPRPNGCCVRWTRWRGRTAGARPTSWRSARGGGKRIWSWYGLLDATGATPDR